MVLGGVSHGEVEQEGDEEDGEGGMFGNVGTVLKGAEGFLTERDGKRNSVINNMSGSEEHQASLLDTSLQRHQSESHESSSSSSTSSLSTMKEVTLTSHQPQKEMLINGQRVIVSSPPRKFWWNDAWWPACPRGTYVSEDHNHPQGGAAGAITCMRCSPDHGLMKTVSKSTGMDIVGLAMAEVMRSSGHEKKSSVQGEEQSGDNDDSQAGLSQKQQSTGSGGSEGTVIYENNGVDKKTFWIVVSLLLLIIFVLLLVLLYVLVWRHRHIKKMQLFYYGEGEYYEDWLAAYYQWYYNVYGVPPWANEDEDEAIEDLMEAEGGNHGDPPPGKLGSRGNGDSDLNPKGDGCSVGEEFSGKGLESRYGVIRLEEEGGGGGGHRRSYHHGVLQFRESEEDELGEETETTETDQSDSSSRRRNRKIKKKKKMPEVIYVQHDAIGATSNGLFMTGGLIEDVIDERKMREEARRVERRNSELDSDSYYSERGSLHGGRYNKDKRSGRRRRSAPATTKSQQNLNLLDPNRTSREEDHLDHPGGLNKTQSKEDSHLGPSSPASEAGSATEPQADTFEDLFGSCDEDHEGFLAMSEAAVN
eukprot:Nk52_evm17s2391 gene=Nk52_evmTU17s2391